MNELVKLVSMLVMVLFLMNREIAVDCKIQVYKPRIEKENPYNKKNKNDNFKHLLSDSIIFNSSYNVSSESRLRHLLLNEYDASLRPVYNSSTPTFVSVSLSNLQVVGLVRK